MVDEDTQKAIELLSENVETLLQDDSTELQNGVALIQAVHNSKRALESFKENTES